MKIPNISKIIVPNAIKLTNQCCIITVYQCLIFSRFKNKKTKVQLLKKIQGIIVKNQPNK